MNLKLNVTISIDDVHPQSGWRILGDKTEKWLRSLNEKYGAKFSCFVPSCYHGKYPLSQHKEWAQELASMEWIELAAHGHLHMTSDPKQFGECEFFEIGAHECKYRIRDMFDEWDECGIIPVGWKSPGWLINQYVRQDIDEAFQYASLHYEHNHGMKWDCKSFFGHDGIQQTNISIHNDDMIMLTSHIAGNWNHNVWNEQNYEQLCISLDHLVDKFDCEFKTLKECL